MSRRDVTLYIQDILDAIKSIKEYTKDMTGEKFSRNKLVIDAVVRNLEIIGEAARQIPAQFKKKHNEIPWKYMSGMRNKISHEYFGVDLEIVWDTIEESLPELQQSLLKLKRALKE